MNGLKLGGNQKAKNSFAFDNQFMDYGVDNEAQSENQEDEEEYEEEEDGSESYAKQSSKGNGKLMVQSNLKNTKSVDLQKKHDEGKRIKKLNNGMEKLSVSILEMKQKYKDLDMQEVLFKKRSEKKQAEIKEFLHEKHEEKRELKKKMKRIKEKERRKLQESISLEEQEKKNLPKKRVQDHMRKIAEMKQKREVSKQKQAMKDQEVSQMYSRIHDEERRKKKFHLRKMEEDTRKKIQKLQKEKQYLAKRKQNYKPIDYEKLDEHAQRHDELLKQLEEVKRAQKQEEYQKILEANHKFDEIFKGQNYDYVQQEYEQRKLKRKQPKEKQEKMKNYQQYVRENFVPRTHQKPSKSVEIESNRAHSHKQVKRYRYFQGASYGEIVENRPVAKSEAEQRKIGNNYMAYMRSLPKKKKVEIQEQLSAQDLQLLDNKLNSIVKIKRDKNPLYERSGRKSLEVKISNKPTRDELNMVLKQLKNRDEEMKMREKVVKNEGGNFSDYSIRHREINQNIVDNIERKLNLLSKL